MYPGVNVNAAFSRASDLFTPLGGVHLLLYEHTPLAMIPKGRTPSVWVFCYCQIKMSN